MLMKKRYLINLLSILFVIGLIQAGQSVFEIFNNAYLHYERREYDDAKEIFMELKEKFPNTEWAVAAEYYLALCLDDMVQSTDMLEDLIEKYPDSPYAAGAMLTMGQYYYALSEYENARKYLNKYIEVSANQEKKKEASRIILRAYLAEEKYVEYFVRLEELQDKYPEWKRDSVILWFQFKVAFNQGDYQKAASLGENMIREYPETPYLDRLYYFTGKAYENQQDNSRAQYFFTLLEESFNSSYLSTLD